MRTPPKLATALLRIAAPNEPALVGDLLERFQAGQSAWWFWRQVLALLGCSSWRELRASAWWSAAASIAAVIALDLPLLFHTPMGFDPRRWLLMASFSAPQAVVIAVPVGLTWGCNRCSISRVVTYSAVDADDRPVWFDGDVCD